MDFLVFVYTMPLHFAVVVWNLIFLHMTWTTVYGVLHLENQLLLHFHTFHIFFYLKSHERKYYKRSQCNVWFRFIVSMLKHFFQCFCIVCLITYLFNIQADGQTEWKIYQNYFGNLQDPFHFNKIAKYITWKTNSAL